MFSTNCIFTRLTFLSALAVLSACANSTTGPDEVMHALAPEQIATLRVVDISGEIQPGIAMPQFQLDRVVQLVKTHVSDDLPQTMATDGASHKMKIKMVFTDYDEGNAFARFMLAGLGQIKLGAEVVFVDAVTGQELGRYKLSKQFAFGGAYGLATRMEDVEEGFAKSVVEILREKKAEILRAMKG
jgi:hypothetical protein